ncbi:hypothetical protein FRC14_002286 [Serendipita sp. 396]|nr:hypothetical protein FRC14_002286 [Serendipita sp. 396]KAG8800774.1 hypothetical protein FRC16_002108 [Serendipita sp. 398]KAG8824564.1 hypothetical protein FRC19_001474 [Serendipita sp. 401]KAG8838946.1 hypothetical protein FRC18_001765 [Serendipita sp. 400]KAG8855759.1 hypothetical protein FRB91_001750 [Serendipita sp. 411]KAG8870670.1 hypothetical protein FRC20_011465 [Serendipita sp. 405]KAG9055743.1 hypothetical protein FS842_001368 [Serendipita sp. 407]
MQLTLAKFIASLAIIATGVAASDSQHFASNHRLVGRRISRKALQARHGNHHHSHSVVTEFHTITQGAGSPSVTTQYVTVTSTIPDASTTTVESASTESSSSSVDSSTFTESPSSSSSAPAPSSSGSVISASGSPCGDPGATPDPSATGGPNGSENWLDCGVDGDGWVPPPLTLSNIIYKDLAEVLKNDGNPFAACADYLPIFEEMSDETGVPTILLASIALQESGCNPSVTGGAGEIGMMQITSEKCPETGDCYDAKTNISIGARYFKLMIDQHEGNVAAAMGAYNGWVTGLTIASANNYAICAQHNNLDYLQFVFNGYLQGISPDTLQMGIYHNTC